MVLWVLERDVRLQQKYAGVPTRECPPVAVIG